MRALIDRNLKLYFRDKVAVFFSLLTVLIVIVLYVLFLAQVQIDAIASASGGMISDDKIKVLINTWVLAGLLSITTVTSTLGGYATMVNDLEKKKLMDFKSSPMKQTYYPVAQFISAFLIGTIISLVALIGYGGYIHLSGIYTFSLSHILKCSGYILLSALMNAALMGFFVSLLKTTSAYGNFSLVLGTIIGFLNGLYVPVGLLPNAVQVIIKILPFGHIAALLRQALASDAANACFAGLPEQVVLDYKEAYGILLYWGDKKIAPTVSVIFIVAVLVVSLILFALNYRRKRSEI